MYMCLTVYSHLFRVELRFYFTSYILTHIVSGFCSVNNFPKELKAPFFGVKNIKVNDNFLFCFIDIKNSHGHPSIIAFKTLCTILAI